jgi:hypothetical protein
MPPCERPTSQKAFFDVLLSNLGVNPVNDILQIFVVGRLAGALGSRSQPVFPRVLQERDMVTLPVAIRTRSMETQDESDSFARLQIARVIGGKLAASPQCTPAVIVTAILGRRGLRRELAQAAAKG